MTEETQYPTKETNVTGYARSTMVEKAMRRIRECYSSWFITEPLLYALIITHRFEPNEDILSLRVGGGVIEFNPGFILVMSEHQLQEVLMFETYRILLKHPYQRQQEDKTVSYFSSSITISQFLDTGLIVTSLSDFGIESEGHEKQSLEHYYNLIKEVVPVLGMTPDGKKKKNEKDDREDPPEGDQNPSDRDKENEDQESYLKSDQAAEENSKEWDDDQLKSEQINERLKEAMESDNWGSVPGSVIDIITATLKPKIDYKSILKRFKAAVSGYEQRSTSLKFNKKHGFPFPGKTIKPITRLGIAVDTSGSISLHNLNKGYSVIKNLFSYDIESAQIVPFDADVKVDEIQKLQRYKPTHTVKGRGGTDLVKLMDYIKKSDIDNWIVITDGAFDSNYTLPKNKVFCWLLYSEKRYKEFIRQIKMNGRTFAAYIME